MEGPEKQVTCPHCSQATRDLFYCKRCKRFACRGCNSCAASHPESVVCVTMKHLVGAQSPNAAPSASSPAGKKKKARKRKGKAKKKSQTAAGMKVLLMGGADPLGQCD